MSYLTKKFLKECEIAGWCDAGGNFEDGMQKAICDNVIEILDVISGQGHSGFSFSYMFNLLEKAARQEPITPLTGDDSEFKGRQNQRRFSVFKDGNLAYDTDGYYFVDESGCSFSNKHSHIKIEFPYAAKVAVRVDVVDDESGNRIYPDWFVEESKVKCVYPVGQ